MMCETETQNPMIPCWKPKLTGLYDQNGYFSC